MAVLAFVLKAGIPNVFYATIPNNQKKYQQNYTLWYHFFISGVLWSLIERGLLANLDYDYADITKAIIQISDEIYQYVGDEIVVSWKL